VIGNTIDYTAANFQPTHRVNKAKSEVMDALFYLER
jgi:hypothetical protein